ncbi:hypothetical protein B484DRAFT_406555, partial [Ochromonadaceae sp. CCMP2298]
MGKQACSTSQQLKVWFLKRIEEIKKQYIGPTFYPTWLERFREEVSTYLKENEDKVAEGNDFAKMAALLQKLPGEIGPDDEEAIKAVRSVIRVQVFQRQIFAHANQSAEQSRSGSVTVHSNPPPSEDAEAGNEFSKVYSELTSGDFRRAMQDLVLDEDGDWDAGSSSSNAGAASSDHNSLSMGGKKLSAADTAAPSAASIASKSGDGDEETGGRAMFRGGLDPRQVPIQGLEGRCNAFLDEISKRGVCRYMLLDAGFLGVDDYEPSAPAGAGAARPGQGVGRGQGDKYLYANEFAFDVRRVLGNFLRYNFDLKARRSSADVLLRFEQWWAALQQELQASTPGHFYFQQPLPELRWLLAAYDELVKIKLQNYLALVPSPICYGDIVSAAVEGECANFASLKADVRRIHANCTIYWSQEQGGQAVIDDALRLEKALLGSLESSAHNLAGGDPKALELLSAGEAGADRGSAPAPKLKSKT